MGLGASWYIPLTYLESISISLTVSLLASWRYIQAHGHLVTLLDVRRSGHGLLNDSAGDGLQQQQASSSSQAVIRGIVSLLT